MNNYNFIPVFPQDKEDPLAFFFIREDLVRLMPEDFRVFRNDVRIFNLPIEAIHISPTVGIVQMGSIARGGWFTQHDENTMELLQNHPVFYKLLSKIKHAIKQ